MRIAVISTPFISVPPAGYGGTELFCYELVEELTRRGHDVTLYATSDSRVSCRKRALYHRAAWPPTAADEMNHVAWAFADIAKSRFDLVHLNNALGIPLSRFVPVPIVYTLHHARHEPTSRIYAIHPDINYVGISRRQLDLEVPLPISRVIHHGVSPDRYPPTSRDEGYLLHIGRHCAEKGTHLAIDAARAARMPLYLAGRTHEQDKAYFEEFVAPRLGGPGLVAVGEADHATKVRLMQGARGLICPLQWEEPFGLVAIEAMLCGTPVIGFPRGSFGEIVEEGVTGFLASDGKVATLARLAQRLEGFDRIRCAKRARERFTTQVMVSAYEDVYRSARRAGGAVRAEEAA